MRLPFESPPDPRHTIVATSLKSFHRREAHVLRDKPVGHPFRRNLEVVTYADFGSEHEGRWHGWHAFKTARDRPPSYIGGMPTLRELFDMALPKLSALSRKNPNGFPRTYEFVESFEELSERIGDRKGIKGEPPIVVELISQADARLNNAWKMGGEDGT